MKAIKTDLIVVGAGVVGLAAACLAATKGFTVSLLDKQPPPQSIDQLPQQIRTIALNQATLKLLDQLNVWTYIDKKRLGFMDRMHILAEQGDDFTITAHDEALSVVIENQHLQWALYQTCLTHHNIHMLFESAVDHIYQETDQVALKLTNASYLEAKLLIAADGANSWLAKQLDMTTVKKDYQHVACVGLAKSEKGLQDVALQTCGEKFILGILPTSDEMIHSIIFACSKDQADQLLAADKVEQDCILTNASQNALGLLTWQSDIVAIPLQKQHLEHYFQDRVVFVGDAAHRIHPLAGQGANMGFADVETLMQDLVKAQKSKQDIGAARVLKHYELQQKPKNQIFLLLHDALKAGLTVSSMLMHLCRKYGFKVLDNSSVIKKLMQKVVN